MSKTESLVTDDSIVDMLAKKKSSRFRLIRDSNIIRHHPVMLY